MGREWLQLTLMGIVCAVQSRGRDKSWLSGDRCCIQCARRIGTSENGTDSVEISVACEKRFKAHVVAGERILHAVCHLAGGFDPVTAVALSAAMLLVGIDLVSSAPAGWCAVLSRPGSLARFDPVEFCSRWRR